MINDPINLLRDFVTYCNSIQDSAILIVEGKRDIEALKIIGINLKDGKFLAHKGYPINDLIDIVYKTPVILTTLGS